MEIQFVYQNLTEEQKNGVIHMWVSAGVLSLQEAQNRVNQVSVLILSEGQVVGVSTIYPALLNAGEKPWFFLRMFIQETSRGSNRRRTQIMQLNYTELKQRFSEQYQGIALELENVKLAKLSETTDYMSRRGYTYYGKSSRGLGIWEVRFDTPMGIFDQPKPLQVLKIIGIPDDNRANVVYNDGFFQQFALLFDGNSSFLEKYKVEGCYEKTLYIGGERYPEQFDLKQRPDVIVNMICDPEIHTKSLSLLNTISLGVPFINRPELIHKTSRDRLSQELPSSEDFVIPKTLRITPYDSNDILKTAVEVFGGSSFLFRPVVSHGGEGLIRIDDYKTAPFTGYPMDGKAQYFMTEFIDCQNSDGLYRKMRFFIIDGVPYPRHKIVSESWMIHSQSRSSLMSQKSYQEEEKSFLENPPPILKAFCAHVYNHLQLDYFGIDCALSDDGKVVLFEANVCMRPYADHDEEYLKNANEAVHKAFGNLVRGRS
ncbi:MAG: hypothetical protein JZU62_01350 [Sulfuricurvum sp.]|uniref:ATP-grasp domain-containing protein n=1 Tax=Sulfuricurvum sp. TaxID=2025608 RepID=UPI0025F6E64A|nr:hypothetical protein [Sulfuricurvum sp.]MBV5320306.1 hypothetical protein [Sulfuricurvum sp.]